MYAINRMIKSKNLDFPLIFARRHVQHVDSRTWPYINDKSLLNSSHEMCLAKRYSINTSTKHVGTNKILSIHKISNSQCKWVFSTNVSHLDCIRGMSHGKNILCLLRKRMNIKL